MTDMTMTTTTQYTEERDQFIDRLLEGTASVFSIFTIYIGHKLGLYRALAERDAMTSQQLAAATGTHERYIREWLEQQTVSGILTVEDETLDAAARRFSIPASRVEVLVEQDSPNYLAPLAQIVIGAVHPLEQLLNAYRNGGGVPYGDYGADLVEGQAGINRALFLQELGQDWLPSIADIHAQLQNGQPARIADIGCGAGWSSIGMAQAYPNAVVDGYDMDAPSIQMAETHVREAGLHDRVRLHVQDAGESDLAGQYDLVTAFECVHDMSDPVSVLRTMRRLAGDNGSVLVVDERVGETFTAEGNDVEWMMYGWSVLHCLPVGMADHPSVGTGTVMRPDTLKRYALEAGFSDVEILPIDNFFFRVYRLVN